MTIFTFLAPHDSYGVPSNIENEPIQTITNELLDEIDKNLPGGSSVVKNHPDWIRKSDIYTIESCEITITFVTEGAGYKNGLGYYVYDKDSPPNRFSDISNINVVFPNASLENKGGKLKPGHTMKLIYETSANGFIQDPNPKKRFVIDHPDNNYVFPKDKGIGFVCFANQWKAHGSAGAHLNINHRMYSSDPALNPERNTLKDHCVNFRSNVENTKIIYGFEDLRRDHRSDDDFNDMVYYITPSPIDAIDPNSFNSVTEQNFNGYILCEDIKKEGDFDYNDVTFKYNITELLESQNNESKIKSIIIKLVCYSRGADFNHNFGVIFPNIKKIEKCKIYQEIWIQETEETNKFTLSNSVINSGSDKICLVKNTKNFLANTLNQNHTNTDISIEGMVKPSYSLTKIIFPEPVSKAGFVEFPYRFYLDVFKKSNIQNGLETGLLDHTIYSDYLYPASKKIRDLGLNTKKKIKLLPDCNSFMWVKEGIPLRKAYNKLIDNLLSEGTNFVNWYSSQYRKNPLVMPLIDNSDESHSYEKILLIDNSPYDNNSGLLYKSLKNCDSYKPGSYLDFEFSSEYLLSSNPYLLIKDNLSINNILDWSELEVSDSKKIALVNFIKTFGECYILVNSEYSYQNTNRKYFVSLSSIQTNPNRLVHSTINVSSGETLELLSWDSYKNYIPFYL